MDLDSNENILRKKLQKIIKATGKRSPTDELPELLDQICLIAASIEHLFDAFNLHKNPNTWGLMCETTRQCNTVQTLDQDVSIPKTVDHPNPPRAVPNLTNNNTGVALTFKAGLCTGILIGTIFRGFILKCLSFVLVVGGMTVMYLIIGSMHKSQGSKSLLMQLVDRY